MKCLLNSATLFTSVFVICSTHASPPYSSVPVTQAELNTLDEARYGKIHTEIELDAHQVDAFFKINNACTNSIKANAEFVKSLAWFGNIKSIKISSLFAGTIGERASQIADLDLKASAINFETQRFVQIQFAADAATQKAGTHFAAIFGEPKDSLTVMSCYNPVLRRLGKTPKVEDLEFFIADPLPPETLKIFR